MGSTLIEVVARGQERIQGLELEGTGTVSGIQSYGAKAFWNAGNGITRSAKGDSRQK